MSTGFVRFLNNRLTESEVTTTGTDERTTEHTNVCMQIQKNLLQSASTDEDRKNLSSFMHAACYVRSCWGEVQGKGNCKREDCPFSHDRTLLNNLAKSIANAMEARDKTVSFGSMNSGFYAPSHLMTTDSTVLATTIINCHK